MSKNLIPQTAKMLGVEIGEKFKIKGYEGIAYRFDADGLKVSVDDSCPKEGVPFASANAALCSLLAGKLEIIKLPWKPKESDIFYTFDFTYGKWGVKSDMWAGAPCDYALLDKGWVYRTRAEAEAALPEIAEKFGANYVL